MVESLVAHFSPIAHQHAIQVSGHPCIFLYDTDTRPFLGGECVIFAFEVQNSAKDQIGIRMKHTLHQSTATEIEEEAQNLKAIKKAQISRLPVLLGYSASIEPHPFFALS